MTIQIPFPELESFVSKASGRPVQVKCTGKDTIEVHYIATVTLSIADVKPHGVVLNYKTNPIVGMMIKGMRGKIRSQLEQYPFLNWDEDDEQVSVDLDKIKAAQSLLSHAVITGLSFDGDQAVLGLKPV
jgi:hypothetical protein